MRLVYITLGWVMGLFVAAAFDALVPLFWLSLLAVTGGLSFALWQTRWRWFVIACFAFAFAGYRFILVPQTSDVARYNDQGNVTLEGVVLSDPDVRDQRVQIRIIVDAVFTDVGGFVTSGMVLVNAPRTADLNYGDRVQATGRLATPAEFDTFSYSDYLARQGVFSVMQDAIVTVQSTGHGNIFYRSIFDLRATAQAAINNALPDPQAALLSGILLGNERGIDPDLNEAFQRVGASHIIAISGFNMVIISELVLRLLQAILRRRWQAVVAGLIVIGLYTILVGANAAVVRAAIMSGVLVVGRLLDRPTYLPASLAFVALVMTLFNPLVLWSISFQLSFFAVLGLALFTDPLSHRFEALLHWLLPSGLARQVGLLLNEPLIVTLASLALTMPLTAIYFQRVSLLVLVVNVLIVPVQAALLLVGGLAVLLAFVAPALAQVIFWADMLLLSWSITIVRMFAGLPNADVSLTLDGRLIALLYILILGGAIVNATRPPWLRPILRWLYQRRIVLTIALSGLGLVILMLAMGFSRSDGRLRVWWLDVGHSNAVLIQTPGGAQILVDGGRFPSRLLTALGDRLPFYDREIEIMVVSQPDPFDTSALPAVLSRYQVGTVLTNGQVTQTAEDERIRTAIGAQPMVAVHAGYTVNFDDGTVLEVLHPQTTPEFGDPLGDGTMVLRLSYGDVSILLPGDLSLQGQFELLDAGQWPLATVLQMPQQGTQRSLSTAFLEAIQPQAVILQSDAANFRNDPAQATMDLVADYSVWRTDEQGTLHLWTDGRSLWIVPEP